MICEHAAKQSYLQQSWTVSCGRLFTLPYEIVFAFGSGEGSGFSLVRTPLNWNVRLWIYVRTPTLFKKINLILFDCVVVSSCISRPAFRSVVVSTVGTLRHRVTRVPVFACQHEWSCYQEKQMFARSLLDRPVVSLFWLEILLSLGLATTPVACFRVASREQLLFVSWCACTNNLTLD